MASGSLPTEESGGETWRRSWQIPALLAGTLCFLVALMLWKWPLSRMHRVELADRVREATNLLFQPDERDNSISNAWETVRLLEDQESQLWRNPRLSGDLFFLLGMAYGELANASSSTEQAAYHKEALRYLRAAEKYGVSKDLEFELDGRLGRALFLADKYQEAIRYLTRSIAMRRLLQQEIDRRLLLADLDEKPLAEMRLKGIIQDWGQIPDMSSGQRRTQQRIAGLFQKKDYEAMRQLLEDRMDSGEIDLPTPLAIRLADPRTEENRQSSSDLRMLRRWKQHNVRELSNLLADLTAAYRRSIPPNFDEALNVATQWTQLPGLERRKEIEAQMQRAELLLDVGKPVAARDVLNELDEDADSRPLKLFLLGRTYLDEGRQLGELSLRDFQTQYGQSSTLLDGGSKASDWIEKKFGLRPSLSQSLAKERDHWNDPDKLRTSWVKSLNRKAISNFDKLASDRRAPRSLLGQSLLLKGRALLSLDDPRAAAETFEQAIRLFPDSDFARAAAVLEAGAELDAAFDSPHYTTAMAQSNPGDAEPKSPFAEAINSFARATEMVGEQDVYRNAYLPLTELRSSYENAWLRLQESGHLADAMKLANLYRAFALPGRADQMYADSAQALARKMTASDNPESQIDGRKLFRDAGDAYYAAAQQKLDSLDFADFLWLSALTRFEGQAFDKAQQPLEEFLRVHGRGERDLLGNIYLARCYMADGKLKLAMQTLESALERDPRSPNRFEGRLYLAKTYMELARELGLTQTGPNIAVAQSELYQAAQTVLLRNTDGLSPDIDPTSREWRESLFLLGSLFVQMGRYSEAIEKLDEAIRRYPSDPHVLRSRFLIADSYWREATEKGEQIKAEPAPAARTALEIQRNRLLTNAQRDFMLLADELTMLQRRRPLQPEERELMYNAFFNVGLVHQQLGQPEQAIAAFEDAAEQYIDRAESLSAYMQIANVYFSMNQDASAQSTLRQARYNLEQLDDAAFDGAALSRDEWTKRLNALIEGL